MCQPLPNPQEAFARTYATALHALRAARLSRIGRSTVEVHLTDDTAQLRFRRYPTLPWEPCGPEVSPDLAPALELAAADAQAGWREPVGSTSVARAEHHAEL